MTTGLSRKIWQKLIILHGGEGIKQKMLNDFWKLKKSKKQSRAFGCLIFLGIFFIILAILSYIKIVDYAVYKNPQFNIQMKYPDFWSVVENPGGTGIVVFVAPPLTEMDTWRINVNITYVHLPKPDMTLEQFSKITIRQLTGTFGDNIKVVESKPMKMGNLRGYLFGYVGQGKVEGKEIETPVQYLHAWVIVGPQAYIITYTALKSDYKVYAPFIKSMMKSFQVGIDIEKEQ